MTDSQDRIDKAKKLIEKAKQLIQENKPGEAEGSLRQAMALDKNSVDARVLLARILGATDRMDECGKVIDEALKLDANSADALALKGLTLSRREDYQGAIEYYRRAIAANPQLSMAYFNLGGALREIGTLDESETVIRKGLALEPNNHYGHYELAQSLAYQLKVEESIHEVYATLKLNPFFLRGYLALAKLFHEGKETDEAIKVLEQCLKTLPEATDAAELLKDFYMLKGDFASALRVWDGVVSRRGNAEDLVQLGNIGLAAGEFGKAEEAFKRAVEVDNQAWKPHYALAELYDVAKLEDLAGPEYKLAVQYNDNAFEPHNGYGLFLMKQGELEDAVRELSLACKLAPEGELAPTYNLALALVDGQLFEDAAGLLNTALEDAPQGEMVDEMRRLLNAINRELGV